MIGMKPAANDLLLNINQGVATITLNRPHKLNALTMAMWRGLGDMVSELDGRKDIGCIVIRGAGEKSFSPGNDISEFASNRSNREQAIAYGALMHKTAHALDQCMVPIVAQIHGICVGGGLEIAALADIRICGQSSRFGAPIKNLGLVMAHDEMAPLIRLIGESATLELLLEGQIISADHALQIGLVNKVVPDEQVAQQCAATVHNIVSGAPLVARWHKQFAKRLRNPAPLSQQEYLEGFDCFDTGDFLRGYQAFLAKTTPRFEAN
jgi:enoyl-CoA hydratase